jgi:hypothetical protein
VLFITKNIPIAETRYQELINKEGELYRLKNETKESKEAKLYTKTELSDEYREGYKNGYHKGFEYGKGIYIRKDESHYIG